MTSKQAQVLVVDDESAIREMIQFALRRAGMDVHGAADAHEALTSISESKPDIILMDEPASALDPIATLKIEELMRELAKNYTIIVVTHNMQQASRVSDYTAFMYLGELIEYDATETIFLNPNNIQTEDYVSGKFGY